MSTWGQIRFLLQTAAPGVNVDLIDGYLNSRYEQILGKCNWKGVTYHYTLITQAAYQSSTDTVTATVGSNLLTGAGTNWQAGLVGTRFYIPGDTNYYTIKSWTSATSITLDRPYEGNGTDAPGVVYAASPYVFMQHIYQLPQDVKTVVSALDPVTGFPLTSFSKENLDLSAGPRTLVTDPTSWCINDDSSETTPPVVHQIEFFPPPLYARGIPIEYLHVASGFDGGSTNTSPFPFISDTILLEGCRADIAMFEAKQASSPAMASIHLQLAKGHEAKYQEELASLLRQEFIQRRQITPLRMAERFTRHRLNRAGRNLNNTWGPGVGGPN